MGTPAFAVPCLEALLKHDSCIVTGVVCQPDKVFGRHKEPQPPPVKVAAMAANIPVAQPRRIKGKTFRETLVHWAPDLIVVTAYGRILPRHVLELPPLGCVNAHASLLPRWRGAAPIQWSIRQGDAETGVCLMQMDEGLDTGPVLACRRTRIEPTDTGQSLHDRLADLSGDLLYDSLCELQARALPALAQEETGAVYARMLSRTDGEIDFHQTAEMLANHIRGFYPWPGAWTRLEDRVLKLFPFADVETSGPAATPGTVLSADTEGLRIACADGSIRIHELQLQGRRRMNVADFLRGCRLPVGTLLG
jgi:methionyl-tRNA formyltransferase